jgi:hypothetical protein
MTPPGDTTPAIPGTADGGTTLNPQGAYIKVKVLPLLGGPGLLVDGTGTLGVSQIFSAGQFDADDLPEVDKYYNITAFQNGNFYQFPRWKCVHSGGTSDFTEN